MIREYLFEPTGEKMKYALFAPRKLGKGKPAPPVVALHGDRDDGVDVGLVRGWVVLQSGEKVFDFLDRHARPQTAPAP